MTTVNGRPRAEAAVGVNGVDDHTSVLPKLAKELRNQEASAPSARGSTGGGRAYGRLVAALTEKNCQPGSGSALCPAHGDQAPSLSFKEASDFAGVVVKCHAGCTLSAILTALNLEQSDLFDGPLGGRAGHVVVAEYVYTDEVGEPLFIKERRSPKDFRCKLPDGTYRLGDVRRVLYRLPDVLAAVKDGRTVYVVEGEKDVDALRKLGVTATCNFDGAAQEGHTPKWRKDYAEVLHGGNVVVIADNDPAGHAHARAIVASLRGVVNTLVVKQAAAGKDVTDHLASGRALDELAPFDLAEPNPATPTGGGADRRLKLTKASQITARPVLWLWQLRIALGTLALLAGREGIGKSTLAYQLAADVTRGALPGRFLGVAKSVIVAATEDSWAHTIVPRLVAAGADLDRVYRVDVVTSDSVDTAISLPRDLAALERAITETDTALVLLDPLLSRLNGKLDTHKDSEVRQALEPLTAVADRTGSAVLGLIHVNKSTSQDPLTVLMGSRAFAAVARAVLFVMRHPDDDTLRVLGQPKNNLGSTDLPSLTFRIEGVHVGDTDAGAIWTGHIRWEGEIDQRIDELLASSADSTEARSATAEAADWLEDHLQAEGGTDDSAAIKKAGARAGHSQDALKRARGGIKAEVTSEGFPRRTTWTLPQGVPGLSGQHSRGTSGETAPTALTAPTAGAATSTSPVGAVGAVGAPPATLPPLTSGDLGSAPDAQRAAKSGEAPSTPRYGPRPPRLDRGHAMVVSVDEDKISALAHAMSSTGLRVDTELAASRLEEQRRRQPHTRVELVDALELPPEQRASAQPWASRAGLKKFANLVGPTWPRHENGSPVINLGLLRSPLSQQRGARFATVCALIQELIEDGSFLTCVSRNLTGDRIHPRYGNDTVTGRWTSRDPNVLGVGRRTPRLLRDRDLILAEREEVFIGVDLSTIDARAVAGLSGDQAYAALFQQQRDVHAEVALLFFGDPARREEAKAITHGVTYGRGAASVAEQTGLPLAEAQRLIDIFFRQYPQVQRWQDNQRSLVAQGLALPTGTGRTVVGDEERAHTTGAARVAQACAQDLATTGLLRLVEAGLGRRLRLFLHDEVVLSVPAPAAADTSSQVLELMSFTWQSPSGLVIPIVAHPAEGTGTRWSDLYSPGSR